MSDASNQGFDRPRAASHTADDLGVKRLLVAAPADTGPTIPDAHVADGGVSKDLFDGLGATLAAFDQFRTDTSEAEAQTVADYRRLLRQRIGLAIVDLLDYLEDIGADVVAVEDRQFHDRDLVECARGTAKAGEWLLPTVREHLEATLPREGYQVRRVPVEYTTQQCHVCGELVDVGEATVRCDVEACPVDRVCRDRSAAVTIARRAV